MEVISWYEPILASARSKPRENHFLGEIEKSIKFHELGSHKMCLRMDSRNKLILQSTLHFQRIRYTVSE